MDDAEAINILGELKLKLTAKEELAVIKGIGALTEKIERDKKAQALKEQHKHKCKECAYFAYNCGGLDMSSGNCYLRDSYSDTWRKPNNRACKDFELDDLKPVVENILKGNN